MSNFFNDHQRPIRSAEGNCENHGAPDVASEDRPADGPAEPPTGPASGGEAAPAVAGVGFRGVSFVKDCPVCGERNTIPASLVRMGPRIRCGCGFQILSNLENLDIPANQKVVYFRTRDFFTYQGRLPVGEFWINAAAACFFPGLILAAVYSSTYPAPPAPPFVKFSILLLAAFLHPVFVKRGHDLGLSGVFSSLPVFSVVIPELAALVPGHEFRESVPASILRNLLSLISLVSLAIGLSLAFLTGRKRVNRYGPHPETVRFLW